MKEIKQTALGQGNLLPVTGQYLVDHQEVLIAHSIPVYQVLKGPDGALRASPVELSTALGLPPSERSKLSFLVDKEWKSRLFTSTDSFEAQLEPYRNQSPAERAQAVKDLKSLLVDLKSRQAEPMVKAQAIMDTVGKAFLLNKASLKLKPMEVTGNEREVAGHTESIVTTALELADEPGLVAGLFAGFQSLSNGQTVNHVLRVFASYTGFLKYYNAQHQLRLAQTVRTLFPDVYRPLYRKLLPKLEPHLLVSDHLLQFSLIEPSAMREFALGAFLHDIGKMGNLDYFESDAAYDPVQIQQHVYLSAGLILMNYGNEHDGARLLAGDHHNALGQPGGYGVTRMEREKGRRAAQPPLRILSAAPAGFVSGEALGWLPIEMLAVADVYDAMIDNSRSYKKAMSPAEAVCFLEDSLVAQGRLDPVLVDLYTDFLRSQNVSVPSNRGLAWKASRA